MSAETFCKYVADGNSIKDIKLRGSKVKAHDKWLIDQISDLGNGLKTFTKRHQEPYTFPIFI
jgi:hypothetical protein